MKSSVAAMGARIEQDVFLSADEHEPAAFWRAVNDALADGRRVWVTGGLLDALAQRRGVRRDGRHWLLLAPRAAGSEVWYRVRDVVGAGLGLALLSPLFALTALLIKLSSPGPVFYSTTVVGQGGRRFTWYKFRSMRPLTAAEDEARRREQFREFAERKQQGKVIDSTRVTGIGHILRKYSLDELPQLWNVLRGDMRLVGPRPCLPYEQELFPEWSARRFVPPPGLTGMFQVYGRGRVGLEQGLAMDVYYSYARSFWLDAELILRTLGIVFRGTGG